MLSQCCWTLFMNKGLSFFLTFVTFKSGIYCSFYLMTFSKFRRSLYSNDWGWCHNPDEDICIGVFWSQLLPFDFQFLETVHFSLLIRIQCRALRCIVGKIGMLRMKILDWYFLQNHKHTPSIGSLPMEWIRKNSTICFIWTAYF